jgi:hypothetical protein
MPHRPMKVFYIRAEFCKCCTINIAYGEGTLEVLKQNNTPTLQSGFASSDDSCIHNTCVVLQHSFLSDI